MNTIKVAFSTALSLVGVFLFQGCSGPTPPPSKSQQEIVDTINLSDINVYLENSGSMDGYVSGSTEFENIIYDYLTRLTTAKIKNGVLADSLNLFYINSNVISRGTDIKDFIMNLEPSDFKKKGGQRGNTDVGEVLKTILDRTDTTKVSIFISDCIFSPGKGVDANDYLNKQQTSIMASFSNYLNNHENNLAVIVYRFKSSYNGLYYDRNDATSKYSGERPFYIWLIGSKRNLAAIQSKVKDNEFKHDGVQDKFVIYRTNEHLNYAIKKTKGVELDKHNTKTTISKIDKNRSGVFDFAINVDFKNSLLEESYIMDSLNYATDSDTSITLEVSPASKADSQKYTHTLKFTSAQRPKGHYMFGIKMAVPEWVEVYNDDAGDKLDESTKDKTFGIKYLINGVYDAFIRNTVPTFADFEITIK